MNNIEFQNISFMDKKYTSNNIENDDFPLNIQDSDYETLIAKLKEITSTIALLEKQYK
tara:strand:+ start:1125 stop:1298 length:174 start_codon:yes stop_codon:yes gene_type:complete